MNERMGKRGGYDYAEIEVQMCRSMWNLWWGTVVVVVVVFGTVTLILIAALPLPGFYLSKTLMSY